jgi:hypothetical protein
LALTAFVVSFTVARAYTTFFPHHVLVGGGLHIHHFWYGLALLAVGGWLGIAYTRKEIDIVAAVLYGAGGGLIVDEVGLLLTLNDYQSGLTWTALVTVLGVASVLILFYRYREGIGEELGEFFQNVASPYIGVFLVALSVAFVVETDNLLVTAAAGVLLALGAGFILLFLVKRVRGR